jgi:hypothetical protein
MIEAWLESEKKIGDAAKIEEIKSKVPKKVITRRKVQLSEGHKEDEFGKLLKFHKKVMRSIMIIFSLMMTAVK